LAIQINFAYVQDIDYLSLVFVQVNSHTMVLEWREREHEDENNAAENHQ
jgi:hypothetical protein